jgi:predicted nucleic acid-binding protein
MGKMKDIRGPAVYFDSNTLIYAVEDLGRLGDAMRQAFERVDRGELLGVTSELSLAEVLVGPIRNSEVSIRREYEQLLNLSSGLLVLPISRSILVNAAELRAVNPPLKLPDAIHAATALQHGCTTFLTNDSRFASLSELPVFLLSQWNAE